MKLSESLKNQLDFTMADYVEVNADVIDEIEALEALAEEAKEVHEVNIILLNNNDKLRQQIKTMKCCANCMFQGNNARPSRNPCNICTLSHERYANWQMKEIEDE